MEIITEIDATWESIPGQWVDERGATWRGFYRRVQGNDYLQLQLIVKTLKGFESSYPANWDGRAFTRLGREVFNQTPDVKDWLRENLPDPLEVPPTEGGVVYFRAVLPPDKWEKLCDIGTFDGANWVLQGKIKQSKNGYRYYALHATEEAPHRAYYYLHWDGVDMSFTAHREALEVYRPGLFEAVIKKLEEIDPPRTGNPKPETLNRISI